MSAELVGQLRVPAGHDPESSGGDPVQKHTGDVLGLENAGMVSDGAGLDGAGQVLRRQLRRGRVGRQEQTDANVVVAQLATKGLGKSDHGELAWRVGRIADETEHTGQRSHIGNDPAAPSLERRNHRQAGPDRCPGS